MIWQCLVALRVDFVDFSELGFGLKQIDSNHSILTCHECLSCYVREDGRKYFVNIS
jgi:hypothetical protein